MNTPKVSIVMCTYNRADYLGETIASIQEQTYANWELLIIDNGSDDNTVQVINDIGDPRIVYEKTHKQKVGPAKNIGLKRATGDLIAFMDDDDLWMRDKLEKQVTALLNHPDAGFCYTNGYNFQDDDKIIEYPMNRKEGVECSYIFESYCMGERGIFTIAVMFWKSCLGKVSLFTDSYFFTDSTFIANLAYHFKAVILYEPLFKRRLHAQNTNSTVARENRLEHLSNLKAFKLKGWLPAHIARDASFLVYVNTGNALSDSKQFIPAFKSYLQAWRVKPLSIIPIKKILRLLLTRSI